MSEITDIYQIDGVNEGPYFTDDYRDVGRAAKRLQNIHVTLVRMSKAEYMGKTATSDSEAVFSAQGL